MRRVGVDAGTPVVVYDDQHGAVAARLWWMLDALGHPAAVLDGGMAAWPGLLTTDLPAVVTGDFEERSWPTDRLATADELMTGSATVIDARARARYTGEDTSIDARAGHVPGARNVPWAELVDPGIGTMRGSAELAEVFEAVGVTAGTPVIAYCGSGVTACFDLLALRSLGVTDARLYPASWSGWATDPTRPAALGDT